MSFRNIAFTHPERLAVLSIGSIFLLRMLGLFMLMPIFRTYAETLSGATASLMGVTLGIYGLTQALFQIPFGYFSDRFGRRTVITTGLVLFIAGSMVVALSSHLAWVAVGRALQGIGAIGSVLMVYLSDLTREIVRPRAMALVGMTIGLSFVVALLIAPPLSHAVGVSALFWGMSVAGFGALFILQKLTAVSEQKVLTPLSGGRKMLSKPYFAAVLGGFLTHSALTALFMFLPQWIQAQGFSLEQSWQFYAPVFILSFGGAMLWIRRTEKDQTKSLSKALLFAAVLLVTALLCLWFAHHYLLTLFIATIGFFAAFAFLEAGLSAYVSIIVDTAVKGTAMGCYATLQFLGIFFGGLLGGYLLSLS